MSISEDLRELSRQSRIRVAAAVETRAEQQIIATQSQRRLVQSRELLDRSAARLPQGVAGPRSPGRDASPRQRGV